jgi:serine/threonine protein kinase
MSSNPEKDQDSAPQEPRPDLTRTKIPEPSQSRPLHGPLAVTQIPGTHSSAGLDQVLESGRILQGRWEILEQIGRGGAGRVYKARVLNDPPSLQTFRAVKVLDPSVAKSLGIFDEFVAAQLSHKHLVRSLELVRDPSAGIVFIVMDFIRGDSLANRIAQTRGQLELEKARSICFGILEGLGELHRRGRVHRDLKPSNILLDADDDDCPKIIDFGITHQIGNREQTLRGAGTLDYIAPEVNEGRPASLASDLYSFALLMFHLLHGRTLRHLERPSELLGSVPREACRLLESCLKADPGDRPQNAHELLNKLRKAWPEGAPGAHSDTRSEAAMERHLRAGNLDLVIQNSDIERANGRATWRVSWIRAKALHQKGKVEGAFESFTDAMQKSPSLNHELAIDFVGLLEELGRAEEAVEVLDRVLHETAQPEIVRRQIALLAQCDRVDMAVTTAIRFSVAPDPSLPEARRLLPRVVLQALDANDYKLVIACGEQLVLLPTEETPAPDPATPHATDVSAAVGLAWMHEGDVRRAAEYLETGCDSLPLGARVQQALWSVWNLLDNCQKAADSLTQIPEEVEASFFNIHAESCIRGLLKLRDTDRMQGVLGRIDLKCIGECTLDECVRLFDDGDQHEWVLWLLLHLGRRRDWLRIPADAEATVIGNGIAAEVHIDRNEIAPSLRETADTLMTQLVTVLEKMRLTMPDGHSAAGRLAAIALDKGFDGAVIRGARFDSRDSFGELFPDAQFLSRLRGGLSAERQARLLRAADSQHADPAETTRNLIECIALDARWLAARERLAAQLDAIDSPNPISEAAIELVPLACRPSCQSGDSPDRATRTLARWLHANQSAYGMRQLKNLRPEDATCLIQNCLRQPEDAARVALAQSLALCNDTLASGGSWTERAGLLRLIAAVPAADRDEGVLRTLIQIQGENRQLEDLSNLLKERADSAGGRKSIAATALAAVRFRSGRIQDALQLAQSGPETGEFRLATFLLRAECLRTAGDPRAAARAFAAAERCKGDPEASYVTQLLGLKPEEVLYRGRAACLNAIGQYPEAIKDLKSVPEHLQDQQWALDVANAHNEAGMREDAVAFCRLQLKTKRRSMALIVSRFRIDQTAFITPDQLSDATDLAVGRFPSIAKHATGQIPPIAHDSKVRGEITLAWNDRDPTAEQNRQSVWAAWEAIGAILYQGALLRAQSPDEMTGELAGLECVAPPAVLERVTTEVAKCRQCARDAQAFRTVVASGNFSRRMLDSERQITILQGLSRFAFQKEERELHANWIIQQFLVGRLHRGTPSLNTSLARLALNTVDRSAKNSTIETLAFAKAESVAGLDHDALQRLERAMRDGVLTDSAATSAAIRLGLSLSGSRRNVAYRIRYLSLSPHAFPRVARWLVALTTLLTTACAANGLRTSGRVWTAGTLQGTITLGLLIVAAACLPIEGEREMPEFRRAVREQDPRIWIGIVAAAGIVVIALLRLLIFFVGGT